MNRDPFAQPEDLIRRVYAYVAYRIGDGPEAEDVTSDAFERALRYRATFDPRKGEPVSWMIGIARRCIADATRPQPVPRAREVAANDLADEVAARIDVRRAVAALDARDRELIALRYGGDLTARQIGELLELKTNAVEVALHRALVRLRTELDRDPGPQGVELSPVRV